MNIDIYGKNMVLTPAIKDYIQKKLNALEKYGQEILDVRAEVESDEHHRHGLVFHFDVTMRIPEHKLRAEATVEDMYAAIDEVKDLLERQLRKIKGKRHEKRRRAQQSRRQAKEM